MDVYEFIKDIKRRGLLKVKQSIVVESVFIYVRNSEVYKIALHVNPDMLKKAKKLGLNSEYVIYVMNNEKLKLDEKYCNGNFIIIYNMSKNECDVFAGEISEKEQFDRLKSKCI